MPNSPMMLGYDMAKAAACIQSALSAKAKAGGFSALLPELPLLTRRLIEAHLSYLHVCGALDESGDTGEGDYDEDDAFEYLLDAVSGDRPETDMDALAALIEAFFPAQDEFMEREGLMG